MFCPECGKPNPDENRFCQHCSALLVDNSAEQVQQPVTPPVSNNGQQAKPDVVVNIPKVDTAKVKDFVGKQKKLIIPIVAVVIALIAFFAIGSSLASPEKIVESYFTAYTEGDYDSMYNQLALPESDFLTKEAFSSCMEYIISESGNPFEGVKKFTVEEEKNDYNRYDDKKNHEDKKNDNPVKNYRITIVDKSTGESRTSYVTLIEQDTKTLLFFKNYKVSSAEFISQDATIRTTGDIAVSLDGIALANPEIDEYDTRTYKLPTVFRGIHKVTATNDLYEPYESEFIIYDSYDSYTVRLSNMQFKESLLTALETKAYENVKTLYVNALAGKPFSSDMIKTTAEYTDLGSRYDNLLRYVTKGTDGTGLDEWTFTSGSIATNYSNEKSYNVGTDTAGRTCVSFNFDLTYDYKYTKSVGWYNPVLESGEKSGNDTIYMAFSYDNGEWKLSGMNDCSLYYSVY